MAVDFTPTLKGYTGQTKLRFWCQKVLPLVYDDSLSYYELLNKVVDYLNNTIADVSDCEDNITALRDAFVELQDYVNEMFDDFAPEIERIIDEMIDSGEFGEILTGVVNGLIANEYSTTQGYAQFDYVIKDGKLYCSTASTSGEWDETKWRETTVGEDMQLLNQRVYNLNAGQVAYNSASTYDNDTVGKELQDLDSDITLYNSRGSVTMEQLTDSWLVIANSGQYQVLGGDNTNSFLAGVDTSYGVLTVEFAENANMSYGYVIFHGTNGHLFYRDFFRTLSTSSISWRTTINRIATFTDVASAVNPNIETITATNVTTNVTVVVKKKGSMVRVDCGIVGNTTVTFEKTSTGSTQTVIFATLPESARPNANVYFPIMIRRSGETYFDPVNLYGVIYTNGNIGINIGETVSVVQMILGETYFTA